MQSPQEQLLTRWFIGHWTVLTLFLKSRDSGYSSFNPISLTRVCPYLSNMSWLLTLWQLTLVLKEGSFNVWNPPSLFLFNTVLMRPNLSPPLCALISICRFVQEARGCPSRYWVESISGFGECCLPNYVNFSGPWKWAALHWCGSTVGSFCVSLKFSLRFVLLWFPSLLSVSYFSNVL